MHEWALAEAVMETVMAHLKEWAGDRTETTRAKPTTEAADISAAKPAVQPVDIPANTPADTPASLTVKSVTLLFGELQAIDPVIFRVGLESLSDRYPFGPEVFEIENQRAAFQCNICKTGWSLDNVGEEEREAIHFVPEVAHVYLRCPSCGSPDFSITEGRGVSIGRIVLEEREMPP